MGFPNQVKFLFFILIFAIPASRGRVVKFSKDFLAGATAAVVAKTVIAPVERVKLILQVCQCLLFL